MKCNGIGTGQIRGKADGTTIFQQAGLRIVKGDYEDSAHKYNNANKGEALLIKFQH